MVCLVSGLMRFYIYTSSNFIIFHSWQCILVSGCPRQLHHSAFELFDSNRSPPGQEDRSTEGKKINRGGHYSCLPWRYSNSVLLLWLVVDKVASLALTLLQIITPLRATSNQFLFLPLCLNLLWRFYRETPRHVIYLFTQATVCLTSTFVFL